VRRPPSRTRFWLWLLAAAGLGFGVMLLMAWRVSRIEIVDPHHAAECLAAVRLEFRTPRPLLERNEAGTLIRTPIAPLPGHEPPEKLIVAVYEPATDAFIRVDVPFWMLTLKGPLLEAALRRTGFHVEELGVSAADLRTFGSCTILDETREDGSVLVVGTR
jgi:hypothetical protein